MMKITSAVIVTLLVLSAHLLVCLCCDDGWSEYNGHCYYYEEEEMNFVDAQCACKANDAYLVKLDDQAESDFVTGIITENTWIGTRRALTDCDCAKWFMIHDLTEVPFTSWSPDEPNNSGGTENCVEIWMKDYLWNDRTCSLERKSMCEKEN
ncbi:perlucin-like protein isoform X1 [Ptychodera flava]|uniref:perlucin-like protein isoform X1 n=1 Tax=Ptychodera flava TaxID=63121 RepID=UPI00396A12FB